MVSYGVDGAKCYEHPQKLTTTLSQQGGVYLQLQMHCVLIIKLVHVKSANEH